ncbi:aldehyde dehydrogenase family protein [Longibacter salinarum]|uniref:Aldehyde dehydrogenase n=1 Tax=Longibacter salinarum TaxID=1850348 RepID=A0A2A8D1G4_9BACT|nr:aldehyde dehydrogenase family protein [Longibacter salinarum]PEN14775.1 aldehyde dehydrogenase family protein [Longibacter salinarum]
MPVSSASLERSGTNQSFSADPKRLKNLFQRQKEHHLTVRQSTAAERKAKIQRIRDGIRARRQDIRDALYADFQKAPEEADLTEVKAVMDEASFAIKHIDSWMASESASTPPLLMGTSSEIRYEPKGVVLIISPWNYPFNLTLGPLIAAIAAGNSVIVKPSEYTPHSSRVMREMIEELFDEREVALVEGAVETSQALLDLPFDHIYFTGSPEVGKIVMRAAAEHLSSVTLELGGKSPAIVDATADVDDAAAKIAWGKFTNTGQTCIAPDYALVHESRHDAFLKRITHYISEYYGQTDEQRRTTPDYARLVNEKHFSRVQSLLTDAVQSGATVITGGQTDADAQYIAPTVLSDIPSESRIMDEEIFGPILPVVPFSDLNSAIDRINEKPNPLALYLFTRDEAAEHSILSRTHAGGTCINEVLLHYMNPHIPFGGNGHSGIGMGHGKYAFREFSHARSVLRRSYGSKLMRYIYPPYGSLSRRMIDAALKYL